MKTALLYMMAAGLLLLYGMRQQGNAGDAPATRWMDFAQAADSMHAKPKRIFVKIYTTWCGPCKLMDKKTFTSARVINLLNQYYYNIAFNAEVQKPIRFNDSTYTFNPNLGRGIHNLALHLGREPGNILGYPTVIILDENLHVVYRRVGYMPPKELERALSRYKGDSK